MNFNIIPPAQRIRQHEGKINRHPLLWICWVEGESRVISKANVSSVVLECEGAGGVPYSGESTVETSDGVVAEGKGPRGVGHAGALDTVVVVVDSWWWWWWLLGGWIVDRW